MPERPVSQEVESAARRTQACESVFLNHFQKKSAVSGVVFPACRQAGFLHFFVDTKKWSPGPRDGKSLILESLHENRENCLRVPVCSGFS